MLGWVLQHQIRASGCNHPICSGWRCPIGDNFRIELACPAVVDRLKWHLAADIEPEFEQLNSGFHRHALESAVRFPRESARAALAYKIPSRSNRRPGVRKEAVKHHEFSGMSENDRHSGGKYHCAALGLVGFGNATMRPNAGSCKPCRTD